MPCGDGAVLRSTYEDGRYRVEVANGIGSIGMASIMVTGPGDGLERVTLWHETIRIFDRDGWPIWHGRYDGQAVEYGGPSHPYRDMAQKRARDLLEGRIHEARSIAMGHAIQAGIAARKAMRAQAGEG